METSKSEFERAPTASAVSALRALPKGMGFLLFLDREDDQHTVMGDCALQLVADASVHCIKYVLEDAPNDMARTAVASEILLKCFSSPDELAKACLIALSRSGGKAEKIVKQVMMGLAAGGLLSAETQLHTMDPEGRC